MEKKDKKVLEDIKETAKEQAEKIKDYAKEVKEDVNEHHDFKRYSIKVRKMSSKILNFDHTLYGIFDQVKLSLTYRIKDELDVNEIIEISGNKYQVSSIQKNPILFPLEIDGDKREIECKVATLLPVNNVS